MKNDRNRALYRLYAPIYDLFMQPLFGRARQRALSRLALQAGERLLLAGAGTGLDLPLIPLGVQVTAVDLSPQMLQRARARARRGETHFALMDAQALALPDASYDAVALHLLLSVVPNGAQAVREARRVLRPGGRLEIFDKFLPENVSLTPARRVLGRFIAALGTDPNRRLSELLQPVCLEPEHGEASLLGGQYRIIVVRKPAASS